MKLKAATHMIFLTIFCGVSVFAFGQIFLKAFIEPILQLRAFKGTIADSLVYYSDVYLCDLSLNKEEDAQKASEALRKLGSELFAKTTVVPLYRLWSFLKILPKMSDIRIANQELIALSIGLFGLGPQLIPIKMENNTKSVERIKSALRLPKELL